MILKKLLAITVLFLGVALSANGQETKPIADANKGEALYTKGIPEKNIPACISCHGALGNSGGGINPKLAGQHSAYIFKQLKDFKNKKERNNSIMSPISSNLTEQDMLNVSSYLAKQTIKTGTSKTKEGIEIGQKIYRGGIIAKHVPACAACHSPNGAGIPAQFARIGGQSAEYTKAQLLAFKNGSRSNSPQMSAIAARMSDKEIEAISDYIAGLK